MAGTCPNCGTQIAGQLRRCPNCGNFCLKKQDKCPECDAKLEEEETLSEPTQDDNKRPSPLKEKKRGSKKWRFIKGFLILLCLVLLGVGYYFYHQQQMQEKEQADYERLEGITNPEFYQQFLIDHPDSKYCQEIEERMQTLQTEADEWQQLLKKVNRSSVTQFMQKHPGSLRQRICEDLLDSIDWQDALAIGNEEAVTDYLAKHPEGCYVSDAAEKKNALLLSKVTPEEKGMIRGTLEAFFSKVIGSQDIEAAKAAIPDTMVSFCGKENADAEAIIEYAKAKMAKDVIGLHYDIGQQMNVRKETLPDGNTGFAVEVGLEETISRSETSQPTSNHYRVSTLINHEQKIVRMNIFKK